MRYSPYLLIVSLLVSCLACVDSEDVSLRGTVDVLVVDGTITNLPEPQVIRLSRSKADPLTGRPGTTLLTGARVEIVVDGTERIAATETEAGRYELPTTFRGQVGHTYQLQFTLAGGPRYTSDPQLMPAAPPIRQIRAQFNPTSLAADQLKGFRAAHDLYLDTQDPAGESNYYRWGWRLWERQEWCKSCVQGRYSVNDVQVKYSDNGIQYYEAGDGLLEDCFYPPPPGQGGPQLGYFIFDYPCRTRCWAVFNSLDIDVFADSYSNGGLIAGRRVAQIPFYQHGPCLVEVRQAALTPSAYQFYNQLAEQTGRTGGIADTPPTALPGNVHNTANARELVAGFFTASGVATTRYWLDRRDTQGVPPGLFEALAGRSPNPDDGPPNLVREFQIRWSHAIPPFTAICSPSDSQTPFKPEGWQD